MNVRGLVIGCLLMGTAMACSDDDGGDSGSGGAGGVAASAASGTGGAGGAAIGTGGSGGTAVGTSGTGGAAGVGATGGSGGAVADPTNPASCPATAPNDNDPCTMDALDCGYGATSCTCEAGFGGMALQWNCNTMGGQTMACPAAQPTSGDTCTPGRGDCMFGTTVCDCINDTNTWACWDPADCPDTEPAEQAACDVIGMACDYGQPGQGRGGNNGCECTATGWDCGGQFCPATEPVGGGDCQGGPGVCSYGGDRVCDCDSQIWACWAESDCPTSPPANDSDCPLDGMICPFDGGDCECRGSGWDCDNGVTAGTDADGGV